MKQLFFRSVDPDLVQGVIDEHAMHGFSVQIMDVQSTDPLSFYLLLGEDCEYTVIDHPAVDSLVGLDIGGIVDRA